MFVESHDPMRSLNSSTSVESRNPWNSPRSCATLPYPALSMTASRFGSLNTGRTAP